MPQTWTPERRAAQSERIRTLKPWLKSTGPRTKNGKKRASQNAVKHERRRAEMEKTIRLLKASREFRLLAKDLLLNHDILAGIYAPIKQTEKNVSS